MDCLQHTALVDRQEIGIFIIKLQLVGDFQQHWPTNVSGDERLIGCHVNIIVMTHNSYFQFVKLS